MKRIWDILPILLTVVAGIILVYLHLLLYESFSAWVDRYLGTSPGTTEVKNIYLMMSLGAGVSSTAAWLRYRGDWIPIFSLLLTFMVGVVTHYPTLYRTVTTYRDVEVISSLVAPGVAIILLGFTVIVLHNLLGGVPGILRGGVVLRIDDPRFIAPDILVAVALTVGAALIFRELGIRFYESAVQLSAEAPLRIRGLVMEIVMSNFGYLVILLAYLSIVTYILYNLAEPLVIYTAGLRSQARDLLLRDYERERRWALKMVRIRLIYNVLKGLPYIFSLAVVIAVHILYFGEIAYLFNDPITYSSLLMEQYFTDLISSSYYPYQTPLDPVINQMFNQAELERLVEFYRGLLRLLVRLVFRYA